jgi:hypothetical protein
MTSEHPSFSEYKNRMLPQTTKISSKELERLLFIEKNYERIIHSCIKKN